MISEATDHLEVHVFCRDVDMAVLAPLLKNIMIIDLCELNLLQNFKRYAQVPP